VVQVAFVEALCISARHTFPLQAKKPVQRIPSVRAYPGDGYISKGIDLGLLLILSMGNPGDKTGWLEEIPLLGENSVMALAQRFLRPAT
jgi:hypothetical protein